MPIPKAPNYFFKRPFADKGQKQLIPDSLASASGRASLESGFPVETQLPLNQGGVAPSRLDFNGIFYMLSAMAFWQQSGGLFEYDRTLNYNPPAWVFYKSAMWWCLKENGPDSAAAVVEPGSNELIWQNFRDALLSQGEGTSSFGGNPVGTIIMFHGHLAPEGYLPCDGSSFSASKYPLLRTHLGSSYLPDFRGLAPRGYDPIGKYDPQGPHRPIGSQQKDAGRNITGRHFFGQDANVPAATHPTGSFYYDQVERDRIGHLTLTGNATYDHWLPLCLDASRSWGSEHTDSEFRMANFSILYCIKHD